MLSSHHSLFVAQEGVHFANGIRINIQLHGYTFLISYFVLSTGQPRSLLTTAAGTTFVPRGMPPGACGNCTKMASYKHPVVDFRQVTRFKEVVLWCWGKIRISLDTASKLSSPSRVC